MNFSDGDYFSLGTERNLTFGPGGLTDALTTWLKANETSKVTSSTDGASVTLWEDALAGNYDFSNVATAPTYNDNSLENMNFNQNIAFTSASTSGLTTTDNNDYNLESGSPFVRKGIYIAFRTSSDVTNNR